jgi:hypothetical protein
MIQILRAVRKRDLLIESRNRNEKLRPKTEKTGNAKPTNWGVRKLAFIESSGLPIGVEHAGVGTDHAPKQCLSMDEQQSDAYFSRFERLTLQIPPALPGDD